MIAATRFDHVEEEGKEQSCPRAEDGALLSSVYRSIFRKDGQWAWLTTAPIEGPVLCFFKLTRLSL